MDQFPTDVLKQENMMMMTYLSLTLKQLKQDPCFLVMSSVSRVSQLLLLLLSLTDQDHLSQYPLQ